MSIEIQTEVWRYSKSKGSQRLLLIAIADNCNTESRTAWPTTAYLANKTLLTQRSIHRLVAELEELGELEIARNRGRNRSNLYRIPRFDATQGDITGEENMTSFHIFDDPSYVDDEFVTNGDLATSDEFVPELKCEILSDQSEILSDQSEILSGSNLKSCQIESEISATSNHQEPSIEPLIEPSLTIRGDLTIPDPLPEFYEILINLDHWGGWSLEHCRAWLKKHGLSESQALREASGLRTWLDDQKDQLELYEQTVASNKPWKGATPKPRNKDPWRRFVTFMLDRSRNDSALVNGRAIPNLTPLGRAIRTNNGQVDMEELAREIAERKEATH